MQRLAGVRVWSYIAARADWMRDAPHWQARAREVEDLLSDALHERLTARFVDRRAAHLLRRLESGETEELLSAVTRRGEVVVEGHGVGRVGAFTFFPDPGAEGDARKLVSRAARRALREEIPRRLARLEAEPDSAFAINPAQRIIWDEVPVARLRPGASTIRPLVDVLDSEFLDGPQRQRVRLRLQRFVDARVQRDLAPLFAAQAGADAEPALRGLLHRLIEAGGLVPGTHDDEVSAPLRGRLKSLDVRAGRFSLFIPAMLKPRAVAVRAMLWALARGVPTPKLPDPGLVSLPLAADTPDGFLEAMGWIAAGPVLLRLDIAERAAAELGWLTRRGAVPVPAQLASRFSIGTDLLPIVLRRLGLRVIPAPSLAGDQFGPPAPAMIASPRRSRREAAEPPVPAASGPFAALAALRR